jgi:hypothetical protein
MQAEHRIRRKATMTFRARYFSIGFVAIVAAVGLIG